MAAARTSAGLLFSGGIGSRSDSRQNQLLRPERFQGGPYFRPWIRRRLGFAAFPQRDYLLPGRAFASMFRTRSFHLDIRLNAASRRFARARLHDLPSLQSQWKVDRAMDIHRRSARCDLPAAFDSKGLLYGRLSLDRQFAGIAVFDKSTSTWKLVDSLPKRGLLGADGTRLVYRHGDQLEWVQGLNTDLAETAATLPPER